MISRRNFVATGFMGCAVALGAPRVGLASVQRSTLSELARAKGLFFGSAVTSDQVSASDAYAKLLRDQCDVWTPEWELKWGDIEMQLGDRDYRRPDKIVSLAKDAGKRVRGHTLLWHAQLPEWIDNLGQTWHWQHLVVPWLEETVERYATSIFHWDVVNEPIEPEDGQPDNLRNNPFLKMIGDAYLREAFDIAHAHAPKAKLYINEYDLIYDDERQALRRSALLRLIETLLSKDVPLHGLGLQAHLNVQFTYSEPVFRRFLDEIEAFGLEVSFTELDVREAHHLTGPLDERRQRAADEVKKILQPALDYSMVRGVVTWSLSDRESWYRRYLNIKDNQGLPFDDTLEPAPMHEVLANLFGHARERQSA